MRFVFSLLALCLLAPLAFAQKSPVKFGEVPLEDMQMSVYAKDSSAAAVCLVDYGEAHITSYNGELHLIYTRHTRIKVLTKAGLSSADVSILLYHAGEDQEKVVGLKAATYNVENGKIVATPLSKDGIFNEKYSRNFDKQKFTMPNVKEGSVIEYTYKINSDLATNFPNWEFQRTIPVRLSEYWAVIPTVLIYERYMQGYVPVTSYEKKNLGDGDEGHHWISRDVPAFKPEPYMTSERDYLSKINFALSVINVPGQPVKEIMGSWQRLNDVLLEYDDFGQVIVKSGFLKAKTDEVTNGITDPLQKIAAIHRYIRENIEWDGTEDYIAGNLKKIIEKKKGTSGDINLIMASMLDKANFIVDMVMLSTRDHGFVRKEYPMERQFNYVICSVRLGEKTILLDATEKYLPMTILPERCLNGQGLVISKSRHGWIDIESKAKSKTSVNGDLVLDASGELKGRISITKDGYDANEMRDEYFEKGEENYVKQILAGKSWSVDKTEFNNLKEVEKPVSIGHEVAIAEHASVAGDAIYINPFVVSNFKENPFTEEKRVYPVNYGALIEEVYFCKFTIPETFKVDELPQSKAFALPGNAGRYLFSASQLGNQVIISSNFQINKGLFVQTEYPALREFYNQVVAKHAEQIVLKKK